MGSRAHSQENFERILFTEEQIQKRISELADEINRDYAGKSLIIVGILKGAFMFMSDLVKHITVPCELDFMSLSSYGKMSKSQGTVRIIMDMRSDIYEKHVLVVEDIIDTGNTLRYLLMLLQARKPASLKTAMLLRKPASLQKHDVKADYLAFDCPDAFVIGYGLDYAEQGRNLPFIAELKESVYKNK